MKRFENIFKNKEVWIVADGPSIERIKAVDGIPILAVNYGYKNVDGKVYGLVYVDAYFRKNYQGNMGTSAEVIFYPNHTGALQLKNSVSYKAINHRQGLMRNGVYCGGFGPDKRSSGRSSGVAALSVALGMGANPVRLFGYDYRVFSETESMSLFGRTVRAHASKANHRRDDGTAGKVLSRKINSFDPFEIDKHKIINHSVHSNLPQFIRIEYNQVQLKTG